MGEITPEKHTAIEDIIYNSIIDGNILPLTSACNTSCIFCSHRFNPPGIKVYRIPPRSPSSIKKALFFIDPSRPVVIGESVTRIVEGEPLTHPNITDILSLLRAAFPQTSISLTTNGILLDENMVRFLSRLGNITVNISLNCMGKFNRSHWLGDNEAKAAVNSVKLLEQYGIPFNGSVVAIPHLTGWGDLEETVGYLAAHGAETVRIFEPGFSRLAPPQLQSGIALREELIGFVSRIRKSLHTPITLEPAYITTLEAEVIGVVAGSPAAAAGLQPGDVITAVNGSGAGTRVQVFGKVLKAANPVVTVQRGSKPPFSLCIRKGRGERSGLVMDYDLAPGMIYEMARLSRQHGVRSVLIVTSQLAGPLLRQGLEHFWKEEASYGILEVKNNFFGGTIRAAGLLTVGDIREGLKKHLAKRSDKPGLILLPGLAFDPSGNDLTGVHFAGLEKQFAIPVEAI